jgi:hypothetical protein
MEIEGGSPTTCERVSSARERERERERATEIFTSL